MLEYLNLPADGAICSESEINQNPNTWSNMTVRPPRRVRTFWERLIWSRILTVVESRVTPLENLKKAQTVFLVVRLQQMLTYPSEKGQDSSHYQELTPISLGKSLESNIYPFQWVAGTLPIVWVSGISFSCRRLKLVIKTSSRAPSSKSC